MAKLPRSIFYYIHYLSNMDYIYATGLFGTLSMDYIAKRGFQAGMKPFYGLQKMMITLSI